MLNRVEIDAGALRANLRAFRTALEPQTALGAVVKANAYGHGMLETAALAVEGATIFFQPRSEISLRISTAVRKVSGNSLWKYEKFNT